MSEWKFTAGKCPPIWDTTKQLHDKFSKADRDYSFANLVMSKFASNFLMSITVIFDQEKGKLSLLIKSRIISKYCDPRSKGRSTVIWNLPDQHRGSREDNLFSSGRKGWNHKLKFSTVRLPRWF